MAYYVFDDAKNLFEGMTREQIVNAIANATGLTPEEIDADAVTTAIKEANAQKSVSLWVGTQNEYNAIQQPDENTLYVVTDPHETNELQSQINQLQSEVDNIVAASTTNASGYIIEKLESDPQPLVYNSTFQWYEVANNFVVPEGAEILEYCWKRYEADNHTNDIYASRESDTVVKVVYHSNAQEVGTFILSLVISYPQPITLPELTDIRVGYDGTVYGSAGEAVRKQAFETRFHDYIKQALLNLLAHVAYTDQNGQQYYNALERAMYMTAGVTSITAVFNQGENVIYDTDDLDTLRQYLTVTAYYEDNTSEVITEYTLSGTLEVGTSTITVSYGGKTATFEVVVSEAPLLPREYQEVEWISANNADSSVSAYIDTEFTPTPYSGMIVRLAAVGEQSGRNFAGVRDASTGSNKAFLIVSYSSAGKFGFMRWGSSVQTINFDNDFHDFELTPTTAKVDGQSYSMNSPVTSQSSTKGIRIFSEWNGGQYNNQSNIKLAAMELYENENLVRKYIPCYRKADNVIGLYETVSGSFKTNQGTGSFTKGENV